jgi:hypothetical protein
MDLALWPRQRPVHLGLRFSMKALAPSAVNGADLAAETAELLRLLSTQDRHASLRT